MSRPASILSTTSATGRLRWGKVRPVATSCLRHATIAERRSPRTDHSRVTHSRNQADTGGHTRTRRRSSSSTGGTLRTPQDTRGHGITPVRDREAPGSNPGPPTQNRIQIRGLRLLRLARGGHREVTDFLGSGWRRPVQVDFEPSIELAHGYRTAVMSARARPQGREAPGFENQRRSPRRCAADAQVRTVRHPAQISKVGRSSRGILDSRDGQIDSQAVAVG